MSGFDWSSWLTVIFTGALMLVIRASFIVLPPDAKIPAWLLDSLKYVAAAVLPALAVPDILFRDVPAGEMFNVYRIVAASVAGAYAFKTRDIFGTMALGMVVLWLLKWWSPL